MTVLKTLSKSPAESKASKSTAIDQTTKRVILQLKKEGWKPSEIASKISLTENEVRLILDYEDNVDS